MTPLLVIAAIAVPALLLTAITRRFVAPVRWRIAALMLALAFAFVARGLLAGMVPLPLDEVIRGWPYRGLYHASAVKNFLTNDTVKQILPWMAVAREELAHGRAPLWNRYLFCGYPLLGNGQSAPFSPSFLLTLFVPLPHQLVAMAGLKLFVALLFGFLLLRREGCGEAASLFGSSVFAFAIFNACFLFYPMTAVTLLLPAAAYAFLVTVERSSASHFALAALVVASLLAGGHPESVMHVAMAVVVLIGIELVAPPAGISVHERLRGSTRALVAALIGAGVSAPAWLPVVAMARISSRVAWLKTIPLGWANSPTTLWAALEPDGFGNPAHHDWSWYGEYPHVAAIYFGLIVLVLLVPSVVGRRVSGRDRLLVLAAVLFFLVAEGWTPLAKIFYVAPPFSWVAHDRLLFVVVFLAGVIAARRVSSLSKGDLIAAAVAAGVVLILFGRVWLKMHGRTLHGPAVFTGAVGLVVFVVSMRWRKTAPMVALVCTVVELFVFTADYNALTPASWYVPRLPIMEKLRSFAGSEPFRVVGRDWVLLPNAAAQYQVEDVRGSDPMEWSDLWRLFPAQDPEQSSVGLRRFVDPADPWLSALNVRFLITEPGAAVPGWRLRYAGADGELYENESVLGRFFAPRRIVPAPQLEELRRGRSFAEESVAEGLTLVNPEGVKITTRMESPVRYRVHVETPGEALVASSQPAMPGWRARIGKRRLPVVRVNGAFMGVRVPAGRSDVVVEYRSQPFVAGCWIAVLSSLFGSFLIAGIHLGVTPLSGVPRREAVL